MEKERKHRKDQKIQTIKNNKEWIQIKNGNYKRRKKLEQKDFI